MGRAEAERPIIAVTGDGGFAQYMAELLTAVKHGMNITHVLLNNGQLGKIAKEQRAGDWDVWQTELHNPTSPPTPRSAARSGSASTDAAQLDDALERGAAPTTARRSSRS